MVLQTKLKSSVTAAAALALACWGLCGASLSAAGKMSHDTIPENPGFEDGLDSWTTGGGHIQPRKVFFSADSRVRRSGWRAAKIENPSRNDAFLKQRMPVEADTVYKISGWIRTEGVSGEAGAVGANLAVDQQQACPKKTDK